MKLSILKIKNQKRTKGSLLEIIENVIFDMPVSDSDKSFFTKFPKKLISYIKTRTTENSSILPLRENGLLKTHTKSNIRNQQFHKEFTSVTDTPVPDKGPSLYPRMKDIDIQVSGVEKLLGNINPRKVKSPDEINGRVLKECKNEITPILTIIFKQSLSSGTIPSDWKHANVCPVYIRRETK